MQAFDLNPTLLDAILTANLSQQVVNQYNEWHQGLDPSFKYIKHLLHEYLTANQLKMLRICAQHLVSFLSEVGGYKLPRTFLRAYLNIIQQHIQIVEELVKISEISHNWKSISTDILEQYLNAFSIHLQGRKSDFKAKFSIPSSEIEQKLNNLMEGKEYDSAIRLIQLINYPQDYLEALFTHMVNNKDASKAANFIKTHKLDSKLFPLINKKLNKNMIKYFLNSRGWDAAQEIFEGQTEALWNLIQDLLFKKKIAQAKSVWWRNKDIIEGEVKGVNNETLAVLKEWQSEPIQTIKQSLVLNPYFQDYFGPSDKQRHLSLHDLEIGQENVYFLGKDQQIIDKFIAQLQIAQQCAIDTQSIVGKTKLDKQKDEPPSIIQIGLAKSAYIVDCSSIHAKVKDAILRYISSDRLLLGHALENDLDGLLLALGMSQQQRRIFKFGNVVDTCKLFKAIYPNERHSNLSHICLKALGREVCKKQTLTNWIRRPLRRSQIHYAALDAVCVIHIYRKLEEEVGVNMISYFLEEI